MPTGSLNAPSTGSRCVGLRMPKKIGATATIRRSEFQIYQLYNRRSSIFPLVQIYAGDSFFASDTHQAPLCPGAYTSASTHQAGAACMHLMS